MSDPRYQVDVSVVTRFLADQSQPEQNRFAFAYTITVQNNGSLPAKLLSRHWVITDGDGHVEEVRGAGVVGQQPLIAAGKSHTYSSGTVMTTEDLVDAALRGLEMGEQVTLPPVHDLGLWETFEQSRVALFTSARTGQPAPRYR